MRVTIDGSRIRTVSDVHDALAGPLDFGPYYGRNLNALWDRLSTDVERPVEIVWEDSATSRERLGAEVFERIVQVLTRAAENDEGRPDEERLTVRLT
ncbi:barstar family protein [Kitasatospora sp. NPDC057512]|uniref:barstar family protein n=1 Tax=Kitasatospora sp. NPDC057512 TaxID=3346154 RepID=UPI0036A5193C